MMHGEDAWVSQILQDRGQEALFLGGEEGIGPVKERHGKYDILTAIHLRRVARPDLAGKKIGT